MSSAILPAFKSAHRLVFEHYLRTGERLTEAQWQARHEQKFNPYHDQRGRFSTASGASSSGWQAAPSEHSSRPTAVTKLQGNGSRQGRMAVQVQPVPINPPTPASGSGAPTTPHAFRSNFVLDRIAPQTDNADSYFELNKRQAQLDRLRLDAGPDPHPTVKADLDEFQHRLDTNRRLLEERYKVADREVVKVLRAGLAPADVAFGAANIATGKGGLRDYLAVASVVPVSGVAGKVGKVAGRGKGVAEVAAPLARPAVQLGGPYKEVRMLRGHDAHHLVADSITSMRKGDGPSIAMIEAHHRMTASHGRKASAKLFWSKQKDLVDKGDFVGAMNLGIDDVRANFGNAYDDAIKQAIEAYRKKGVN